ncbi:undecaprenyl diphosphate synthase family protein [Metarhizium album ARSEF 1941]|uniref:Alkyl transferase n=1 Tax=Metarhizium album (strain ARSEF 1941) TaxID=1081103 RepID=A0A0B2WUQ5_METAS|nr:undecaprenyl diphosphate synthase family protein [Metarhizium album ARSEF 1941]KHN97349.1 undecaprenyl diphosphate synthase family protein [Metarhizium album ARSEF 1941]
MSDAVSLLRRLILESPPGEWALRRLRELLIGALRQGPVPQHVAFEMDGNRRYARSHRMETIEGHHRGFEALARIMEICYKCGVKVITVYAFSVENYNRPKHEVEGLMQLAKVKLEQLTTYGDILDRYGACVRVLGQRDMIREDVLQVVDRAVARTKHNDRAVLNICFPYTSRAEITTAIRNTVQDSLSPSPPKSTPFSPSRIRQKILSTQLDGKEPLPTIPDADDDVADESNLVDMDEDAGDSSSTTLPPDSPSPSLRSSSTKHLPSPESITTDTLNEHMYTAADPPLELFVRTSGVERLSDFMLWQCHQDTQIVFIDCLWPDFDLQHFIWVMLEWQWRRKQNERDETSTLVKAKSRRLVE